MPQTGVARVEILDLTGRRVWSSEALYVPGAHNIRWDGRASRGGAVPAGVYFVRLVTPFGERTARVARL